MDNKTPESQEQHLDDQLSEFTDRVLSGGDDSKMPDDLQHAELARLQKNVLRMKAASQKAHPSAATIARVRARLLRDWEKHTQPENPLSAWFKRVFAAPATRLSLAGGLAAIFILGIARTLLPGSGSLTGTAPGGLQGWGTVFALVGAALIALLFWLDRQK